jgi:superfamily I DNA and/or RNA helicase
MLPGVSNVLTRAAMLKTQYRMSPEIGELVSECFYPEKLEAGRSGPPAWFSLAPERLRAIVTWIDTSANGTEAHDKQHRGSTSFDNPFEAREILDLLKAVAGQDEFLQHLIKNTGTDERPIGVICMYADQKRLIQKHFDEQDWSSQLRRLVKIDTVDSYQGKQNRIIILSATRNNNSYSQGHLASPERVNVSISRAMDRLIIVGATRMWRSPNDDRPLGKVLRFIEARQDGEHFAVIGANSRSRVMP